MTRRMLIDATHVEETRVAVVSGHRLDEYDVESSAKKQLKGNVYLAKITRVEPSLQAAFVEYGGNRHGFLAFNEIHPDYYQIPVSDRERLIADEQGAADSEEGENGDNVETIAGDDVDDEVERRRHRSYRGYKIQEVIKRRQIMLVQVVKEERGNKGAALTTYLSLAGRYCVLMPNTARGGGISRKIASATDRKRLKKILDELEIPEGMAVIVRTAGAGRTKAEIRRDYDYLLKRWDEIRTTTLESTAPALIHEEANLIKRAIRDLYTKEIDEILVEGEAGYRLAKDFMRTLTPSHARRVQQYKDDGIPLLHRYQVEAQIDAIHEPIVQLVSGGSIVMHPTEALVSIDVNSGRSTRERNIEETALKTNIEAATEIARQLRLRDLAGLIVIDFIDMEVARNVHAVERRLKEALKSDRARIQVGRISHFGLLEMSRQRMRPSVIEAASQSCPTCGGVGYIRSTESSALHVLRAVEEEGIRKRSTHIAVEMPTSVALYILNQKRAVLADIEQRYGFRVELRANDDLFPPHFEMQQLEARTDGADEIVRQDQIARHAQIERETPVEHDEPAERADRQDDQPAEASDSDRKRRRGRRRRGRRGEESVGPEAVEAADATAPSEDEGDDTGEYASEDGRTDGAGAETEGGAETAGESEDLRRSRRRGRRGGRRRRPLTDRATVEGTEVTGAEGTGDASVGDGEGTWLSGPDAAAGADSEDGQPETRPVPAEVVAYEPEVGVAEAAPSADDEAAATEAKPRRRRRRTPRREVVAEDAEQVAVDNAGDTARVPMQAFPAPEEAVAEESAEGETASATPAAAQHELLTTPDVKVAAERSAEEVPAEEKMPAERVPEAKSEPAPRRKPETVPAEEAAEEAAEPQPAKPKRSGWWQRVLSS